MNIALFFGSFNPVHQGHLIIASHIINFTDHEQVWMVVSPQNPFKTNLQLANEYERFYMMEMAASDNPDIVPCNIEFELPKPSFTIDTLTYLRERYPQHLFSIVLGSDNIKDFHRWKNYEMILEHYRLIVYQRPGNLEKMYENHEHITYLNAPLLDISSSFIRQLIRENKSIQYLVPEQVRKYIRHSNLYS
ncbi:MAG TPA: nicotinic acid mononucleotide adenylyltransferase [Saprospirales bacterium]|nr:nicotinic acid mononucleotide adenylyltransferase [Saprospirales bacterium]HAY71062.1 nicotinic acid mononucleotide adenylyltransferase [Saprospirales bacterium]HRQ29529.1 nicotinate (nicotinamide) nucleotide adenylyltransferase [Saprospiraceae bacterium]